MGYWRSKGDRQFPPGLVSRLALFRLIIQITPSYPRLTMVDMVIGTSAGWRSIDPMVAESRNFFASRDFR